MSEDFKVTLKMIFPTLKRTTDLIILKYKEKAIVRFTLLLFLQHYNKEKMGQLWRAIIEAVLLLFSWTNPDSCFLNLHEVWSFADKEAQITVAAWFQMSLKCAGIDWNRALAGSAVLSTIFQEPRNNTF